MVFSILERPTDACSPRKGLMGFFSQVAELSWGKRIKRKCWQLLKVALQLVQGGKVAADRGLFLNHTISKMVRCSLWRHLGMQCCSLLGGVLSPRPNSSASLFLRGLPSGGLQTPAA